MDLLAFAFASGVLSHTRLGSPYWGVSRSRRRGPASSFYVRLHSSRTMRGGARFEVGWTAHTRGGCPGCRFWCSGVVFVLSGSVSVRVRVYWASMWPRERWWGGDWRHRAVRPRHFRGVSGPSPGWCSLTWELTQAPPFPFSRRPWFPSVSFSCLLG